MHFTRLSVWSCDYGRERAAERVDAVVTAAAPVHGRRFRSESKGGCCRAGIFHGAVGWSWAPLTCRPPGSNSHHRTFHNSLLSSMKGKYLRAFFSLFYVHAAADNLYSRGKYSTFPCLVCVFSYLFIFMSINLSHSLRWRLKKRIFSTGI